MIIWSPPGPQHVLLSLCAHSSARLAASLAAGCLSQRPAQQAVVRSTASSGPGLLDMHVCSAWAPLLAAGLAGLPDPLS